MFLRAISPSSRPSSIAASIRQPVVRQPFFLPRAIMSRERRIQNMPLSPR